MGEPSVWVVTGASRGIGLGLVDRILEVPESAVVVVACCRDPSAAQDLQGLCRKFEGRLLLVQLDISDEASVKAAAKQIQEKVGRVDVLVNNAGIADPCEPALVLDISDYANVMRVNAIGPMDVTQQLLPLLRKGKLQKIVNISSIIGSHTEYEQTLKSSKDVSQSPFNSWQMAYRCSKSALNMQTQVLAAELKHHGYTVVSLHPGTADSDMGRETASKTGQSTISMSQSVDGLYNVINGLQQSDTGSFLDYNGKTIGW